MVDHVLPQRLPRHEDVELVSHEFEENAEGNGTSFRPLSADEVFDLRKTVPILLDLPGRGKGLSGCSIKSHLYLLTVEGDTPMTTAMSCWET